MTTYPDKNLMADVFAEVARRATLEARGDHPEDLGYVAMNAIEGAALTLEVLWKKGKL